VGERQPPRLDDYYTALTALDPAMIERAVSSLATKPTDRIATLIPRFIAERFLYDYSDDSRLLLGLKHAVRRGGRPPLPESLAGLFPAMRQRVRERKQELLTPWTTI